MSVNEDTKECVELIARVLIRAFAVGSIFLIIWSIVFILGKDMAFRIHGGLFGITMEQIVLLNYIEKGSSLLLTVNNRTIQIIDAFPEASICFHPLFGPFDHAAHRTVFSDSKQLANLL